MKVFVWARIDHATDNYHREGGVVVFAATEAEARELAAQQGAHIRDTEKPDDVRTLTTLGRPKKPKVYIMPDTGCC